MALLKGELQDDLGNVLYPVTSYDVIVGDVNSKEISDANLCLKNGKYMLVKTNTPTNDLYCIDVIQHNDNFLTQTAQLFATSNGTYSDVKVYVRNKSEGRWTDWQQIATTTKTPFSCTANGGFIIQNQQNYVVNNVAYIKFEIKQTSGDSFPTGTRIVGTSPYYNGVTTLPVVSADTSGSVTPSSTTGYINASGNITMLIKESGIGLLYVSGVILL